MCLTGGLLLFVRRRKYTLETWTLSCSASSPTSICKFSHILCLKIYSLVSHIILFLKLGHKYLFIFLLGIICLCNFNIFFIKFLKKEKKYRTNRIFLLFSYTTSIYSFSRLPSASSSPYEKTLSILSLSLSHFSAEITSSVIQLRKFIITTSIVMGMVVVISLPFIIFSILLGFGCYFLGKARGRQDLRTNAQVFGVPAPPQGTGAAAAAATANTYHSPPYPASPNKLNNLNNVWEKKRIRIQVLHSETSSQLRLKLL